MACTASKVPLFRTLVARGYASQPAAAAATCGEIQTCTLPNKLFVAATETGTAISRVSIAFRAGSRYETYDSQGASHLLRIAAGLSTKNATIFGTTRKIQQIGGSLSVTSDRESIAYTIEVTRDQIEAAFKLLENAVMGQVFKPWEISDSLPRLKVDLALVSDQVRAVEMLHKAAYRNGLGNSIFCPDHQVGKLSSETLQHFYNTNFTSNRAAVTGVNVDLQMLSGYAQSLGLESGAGAKSECKYRGGVDARLEKSGRMASVAVAANGGSWQDPQEGLAFTVLQYAAGISPVTKRGACNGALTKVIQAAAPNTAVSTLNACYSDNGLFGFVASGPAKEVGTAMATGIKALKSASISDEDVARGKARLKTDIALAYEKDSTLIEALSFGGLHPGQPLGLKPILDAVECVQTPNVKAAARKVSCEKITIAAVGNLEHIPYAADLN